MSTTVARLIIWVHRKRCQYCYVSLGKGRDRRDPGPWSRDGAAVWGSTFVKVFRFSNIVSEVIASRCGGLWCGWRRSQFGWLRQHPANRGRPRVPTNKTLPFLLPRQALLCLLIGSSCTSRKKSLIEKKVGECPLLLCRFFATAFAAVSSPLSPHPQSAPHGNPIQVRRPLCRSPADLLPSMQSLSFNRGEEAERPGGGVL